MTARNKRFDRGSLRVQVALIARLFGPLPLSRSMPYRSRWFAGPGRSLLLATSEGQGVRPLHPCSLLARTTLARRQAAPKGN